LIVEVPLAALQVPPGIVPDRDMVAPTQTVSGPVILPAVGNALIVTIRVADATPHTLLTVYVMVSNPGNTPVTTPLILPTVALVLLLLHTPPGTEAESVMRPETQTDVGPVIVPALDNGLTVTANEATDVPHALVTE
jgi:hypothetical protein